MYMDMYIYNNNICTQEREKIEEIDGEDDYIKMLLPILTKKEAAFMTASSLIGPLCSCYTAFPKNTACSKKYF